MIIDKILWWKIFYLYLCTIHLMFLNIMSKNEKVIRLPAFHMVLLNGSAIYHGVPSPNDEIAFILISFHSSRERFIFKYINSLPVSTEWGVNNLQLVMDQPRAYTECQGHEATHDPTIFR